MINMKTQTYITRPPTRAGSYIDTSLGDWSDFLGGDIRYKVHYLGPDGERTQPTRAYQSLHLVDIQVQGKIITPHRHAIIRRIRKSSKRDSAFVAKIQGVQGIPVIAIREIPPDEAASDEIYIWRSDGLFLYWVRNSINHIDLRNLPPEKVFVFRLMGNPHSVYRYEGPVSYLSRFIPPLENQETKFMPDLIETEEAYLREEHLL